MLPLLLFVAFLAIPIVEIYVILQVGGLVGTWPTVGLLIADSVLGAWIVRREGLRQWRTLQDTLQAGRTPERELADAALILVGGALLLTPGFVTDAFGFLAVVPLTRPVVRGMLAAYAKRWIAAHVTTHTSRHPHGRTRGRGNAPGSGRGGGRVIRGDVADDDDPRD